MTTVSLVGAPGLGSDVAFASQRSSIRSGHMATKELAKRGRAHRRPTTQARRNPGSTKVATHPDLVPLANTTWDRAQMTVAVRSAIQVAASDSGADPGLLAALAWRESRFDAKARNHRSSAVGLLQFTAGTWLEAVQQFGSPHDPSHFADAIHKDRSGAIVVTGRGGRAAILGLRSDPIFSAWLAARQIQRQGAVMQEKIGRALTLTDLYLLHVLGPNGSSRFLTALVERPHASILDVASLKILRNAGLLARDGRPLTIGNTYAAVTVMLNEQGEHSKPLLVSAETPDARLDPVLEMVEIPGDQR